MEISKIINQTNLPAIQAKIDALPAVQGEYITKALSSPIKAVGASYTQTLADVISWCSQYAGYNIHLNANDLVFMAKTTYEELLQVYPDVTIEEVDTAIKNGIRGEYGAYVGISVKNLIGFVKSYLEDEARMQAIKIYKEQTQKIKPKSNEEIEAIMQNAYESDIQRAKSGEKFKPSYAMYQWCVEKGHISPTKEEKFAKYNDVKEKLLRLLESETDPNMRANYKSVLDSKELLGNECMAELYREHIESK